ncbi:AGAP013481-PA [Anopheles gambiae str. PEST]|uniref:AGAP013481-PA n=2 Tax=gambiae species complex TaxID=44542 RepID=F5HK61_ANOGA|nr:AGAP013481-PA [Anopheles gambiae str. PEST]
MVYESDFYSTRRVGSSYTRPTISSYTVTTPLRYSGVPRFNTITTTTTTYRTPMPYVAHKRLVPVTRVVTSPPRIVVSPMRVLGSPVRVISSPVRVLGSPMRTVRAIRSPARVIVSPARVVTIRSPYLRPSIINKEFDRIERKYRASPVSSALEQYYNSPSYLEFEDAKSDIRNSTALLLRQLNDPVPRLMAPIAQAAPEPNPKKWVYDPFSTHNRLNSDTYVKSHITDPIRSVRNDIEAMARYHSPASRYVEYVLLDDILWRYTYYVDEEGKNHLASTRIIGSQAYPKTKPRIYNYDTAKVGKDVNVMSYYKSNRTQAKADVEEVIASYRRKLLISTLIRNAKRTLMLLQSRNRRRH